MPSPTIAAVLTGTPFAYRFAATLVGSAATSISPFANRAITSFGEGNTFRLTEVFSSSSPLSLFNPMVPNPEGLCMTAMLTMTLSGSETGSRTPWAARGNVMDRNTPTSSSIPIFFIKTSCRSRPPACLVSGSYDDSEIPFLPGSQNHFALLYPSFIYDLFDIFDFSILYGGSTLLDQSSGIRVRFTEICHTEQVHSSDSPLQGLQIYGQGRKSFPCRVGYRTTEHTSCSISSFNGLLFTMNNLGLFEGQTLLCFVYVNSC